MKPLQPPRALRAGDRSQQGQPAGADSTKTRAQRPPGCCPWGWAGGSAKSWSRRVGGYVRKECRAVHVRKHRHARVLLCIPRGVKLFSVSRPSHPGPCAAVRPSYRPGYPSAPLAKATTLTLVSKSCDRRSSGEKHAESNAARPAAPIHPKWGEAARREGLQTARKARQGDSPATQPRTPNALHTT